MDEDSIALPACALKHRDGQLFVSRPFVIPRFSSGVAGLTAVLLPQTGWAYVNRSGRVVVQDVAVMDNGPNEFHQGLVRVSRGDKWGLVDTRGKIVVSLRYDGMLDYDPHAGWEACTGCHRTTDGEHSWFEGGTWFLLRRGRDGAIVESPRR